MEDFAAQAAEYEKHLNEKIDPKDRESLGRIVLAGQKVMFSEKTHKYMLEMLDKPGDTSGKLAYGIVELMGLMLQQSKGNMPPQLIIPGASMLLLKACEFVARTGGEMNMDIYAEAVKLMIAGLRKQIEGAGQQQQPQQQGAIQQQAQAPQPEQQATQGLIGQGA